MEGIDCTQTITPARILGLRLAGKRFVCRYLAPPDAKYDWKRLRRSEVLACKAIPGLELVCVFEKYAGRAKEGVAAGRADALAARKLLQQLGIPKAPVYFAVDVDIVGEKQMRDVGAYLAGAIEVLGKPWTGVYGERDVIERFVGPVVRYGWQAAAWSHGLWSLKAAIQQYHNGGSVAGISVDLDRATMADYGQVNRPKPAPVPAPRPASKPKLVPLLNIFRYWNVYKGRFWGFRR